MDSQNKLEINGQISKHSCAELFAEISQAKFSGSMRLSKRKEKIITYFENGEVVFAVSNARKHRLFEILLNENAIPKEKLVSIEGFIHDLHLAKKLVEEELLTQQIVDSIFSIQIKQILNTVWSWEEGNWSFSPLARIKEGISFEVDLKSELAKYSRSLQNEDILNRFKSFSESFSMNSNDLDLSKLSPSPNEAFILSRMGDSAFSVDEIRSMSGLPNEELFVSLYHLWLGGVLKRKNWNSYFDEEAARKIADAKVTLKKSATSFEEERERELAEKEKQAAEKAAQEAAEKEEKSKSKGIESVTLDQYLKRVDDAATHYELFDLPPDAQLSHIKKVYFSYAKNFHPDLFHNEVEDTKHQKIQNAFTEIARAYDTLKDKDSRELYDFKLRKVIEASKKKSKTEKTSAKDDFEAHKNANEAASQFDTGYDLLMKGKGLEAIPYLERATRLNEDNARYHAFLGKALMKDDSQRHRAENELQKAIKIDKNNTTFRMMLAELYVEIGLSARAKGELTRLLKKTPNDQDAQSLLDRISER